MPTGPSPTQTATPTDPATVDLLAALLETSSLPTVACDRGGRLIFANAAARDLWELASALAERAASGTIAWFTDPGETPDPLAAELSGSGTAQSCRRVAPAGGERLGTVNTRLLTAPSGLPLGAAMTVELSTQSAESLQRLQEYASDLEVLSEISQMLSEVQDPAEVTSMISTVALGATGALRVVLWRKVDATLEVAHDEAMLELSAMPDLLPRLKSDALSALASSSAVIVPVAVSGAQPVDIGSGAAADAGVPFTVWHEPLIIGGHGIGVLSLIWGGELRDAQRPSILIGSLAQHSSVALERAELLKKLAEVARTDPLTGVANRRAWTERLEHELLNSLRTGRPLSLILIDIDHFKRFNDTFGHPEGDRVLQAATAAWDKRLRRTDLLARVGGEEFAVLLPGCDEESALLVAEQLRQATPCGQTCSLGTFTGTGEVSLTEFYGAADTALYCAKARGRNRVEQGRLGSGAART